MDQWTPLLIALLSHHSFDAREAAEANLAARGPSIQPFLAAGLKHQDAEIARRCWRLWEANRAELIDWADLASFPWIDSLPLSYPGRAGIMLHLRCHSEENDWAGYREATLSWLRAAGLELAEMLVVLRIMRGREAFWRNHGRYPE